MRIEPPQQIPVDLFAINLIQDLVPVPLKETHLYIRKTRFLQIFIRDLYAFSEAADRIHCS